MNIMKKWMQSDEILNMVNIQIQINMVKQHLSIQSWAAGQQLFY